MHELSLSVLDQSPVRQGGTAAQALAETVTLAQAAEGFGYRRYWVAEHHNSAMFAGAAPEILIGQIAARTATIHVGSGGVMLSHYSALKVAETFRLLAAFYPGRIDLGIGRAPGSDPRTAVALAHPQPVADIQQFPRQVADLVGFLHDDLPQEHPFVGIEAQPGPPAQGLPEVWLLGSSDYSARLAAKMGLPFAFADFFGTAGDYGPQIAELYRRQFQPSVDLPEPKCSVALHAVCADTAERAKYIAGSMRLLIARIRSGAPRQPLLSPDDAAAQLTSPEDRALVAGFTKHYIEGDPEMVHTALLAAATRYGVDDLFIATNCFTYADRQRSYELIAAACGRS
ncbi:MAG TPA: LLM class flavin-dependent oxidoreductase [Chloroflexota bacterium]|jgi:luciferase family oxidoreductase group 1|nr:LLM class flavin-dependent oxidoreductase [Chloroflexota bacterium]